MSTEFFNDQWRIPSNENQNKISNYSMGFTVPTDTKINIGNSDSLTFGANDFTYAAWINPTSFSNNFEAIYVSAVTSGVWIGKDNAGNFVLRQTSGTTIIAYSTLPALNTWTHICITRNNNDFVLYYNGSSVATTTSALNFVTGSDVYIGSYSNAAFGFNGKIDQTCIFDYALPATGTNSVATLYGGGTAVTNPMALSPAPVAYYQLGDQSVSTGATEDYLVPNNSLQDYVFNFDGSQLINLNNGSSSDGILGETTSFTVSAWIKPTAGTHALLGSFGGGTTTKTFGITILASSLLIASVGTFTGGSFSQYDSRTLVGSSITFGVWQHISVIYDATDLKIFINGVNLTHTTSVPANITLARTVSSYPDVIGRFSQFNNPYYTGQLSNLSIWRNVVQNPVTLYNNGVPSDLTSLNPTSWYKLNNTDVFNSGTGNWTIKDYGSRGEDGTSDGMTSANLIQSDLQHTSGYSPYAITLDGTGQVFNLNTEISLPANKTVSFWIKLRVVPTVPTNPQFLIPLSSSNNRYYPLLQNNNDNFRIYLQGDNGVIATATSVEIEKDVWYNFTITGDGTTPIVYINGVVVSNFGTGVDRTGVLIGDIGARPGGTFDLDGDISNVAVWSGTTLSSTEVTEVYNQGVPSNLNTFSGTKPTAWWQLGSNSSFNSATSQWTCLDEIGTNNAASSTNMANDDITNGVGYSANGLGTSLIDIVGDAPYSSGNGLSENMDVLDRVKDVPS